MTTETAAQPDLTALRVALVAKLPMFDLMWPDDLKAKWFEAVERICATAALSHQRG